MSASRKNGKTYRRLPAKPAQQGRFAGAASGWGRRAAVVVNAQLKTLDAAGLPLPIPDVIAARARRLIETASKEQKTVCSEPILLSWKRPPALARLCVTPLAAAPGSGERFLILFADPHEPGAAAGRIEQLETEPGEAGRHLQDELESANQALEAVNRELEERNRELQHINSDLLNLISSINVPAVILGHDLRIRRFTPHANRMVNLLPSDIGRSIGNFRLKIDVPDLEQLVEQVIEDLQPREREVTDGEGRTYSMRIRPYRTAANSVEGAVIALFDLPERSAARPFNAAHDAVLLLDSGTGEIVDANEAMAHLVGSPAGQTIWETPALREMGVAGLLAELQAAGAVRKTVLVTDASGSRVPAELSAVTYRDGDRRMARLVLRAEPGVASACVAPLKADPAPRASVFAPNELLAALERTLRRPAVPGVEILIHPAPNVGSLQADWAQLEQILLRIVSDACTAMSQGGRIRIQTGEVEIRETSFGERPSLPDGTYVVFTVSARVTSVAQSALSLPGFSAGLVEACAELRHNGGALRVSGEAGTGADFTILMPRAGGTREVERQTLPEPGDTAGSETILVADDEFAVRKLVVRLLERTGYRILEAANGAEAIRVAKAHKGPIDLLLADVMMPFMSGRELADRLQPLHPRMRVVFMTGLHEDLVEPHGVLDPGVVLLRKPFTREALAASVRQVLDSEG